MPSTQRQNSESKVATPAAAQAGPQNRLLKSLPAEDYERLRRHLQPVELGHRLSLYRTDEQIEFVQFIETGVASLVNTMKNGDAAEVGTIGNEGMVGLPVVFGDSRAPTFHHLERRCCRWLLMTHDRMQTDQFPLTQEFLAMMLGVQCPGVTLVAGALQACRADPLNAGQSNYPGPCRTDQALLRMLRRKQARV